MNVRIVTESGPSDALHWPGGEGTLEVTGDFNGAEVAVEVSPNNGHHWAAVTDSNGEVVLTESAVLGLSSLRAGMLFRISPDSGCVLRFCLASADASVRSANRTPRIVT